MVNGGGSTTVILPRISRDLLVLALGYTSWEQPKIGRPDMAKKSFVTFAQNVVEEQAGKIVDMAKAGYEGAKSLAGDAVTSTAKTAKTLIGKPKRKAAGKGNSPVKKAAALKKTVTKKSQKNVPTKGSTKAAKKKSTVKKSAKRKGA